MAIALTESAAGEILRLAAGRGLEEKVFLRMSVAGGGCSGYAHKLELVTETEPLMDSTFDSHGVSIVVDRNSLQLLDGSTVDYQNDLNRQGFRIDNPHAKSTCGCGNSFSA